MLSQIKLGQVEAMSLRRRSARAKALRKWIVLHFHQGLINNAIAAPRGVKPPIIVEWSVYFANAGR